MHTARAHCTCTLHVPSTFASHFGLSTAVTRRPYAATWQGVSQSGGIRSHFKGWWDVRDDPNVLWIFFEDLMADLPAAIRRVADFLEIPLSESLLQVAVR